MGRGLAAPQLSAVSKYSRRMENKLLMVPDFLRKEAVDNEQADAEDFEDECEQADYMHSSDYAVFMEPEKIGPLEKSD